MELYEVIWKDRFLDKIEAKHQVRAEEVEHVLFGKPHIRRARKGHVKGEDLYAAYGQTRGRSVFDRLVHPQGPGGRVANLSARYDGLGAKIL